MSVVAEPIKARITLAELAAMPNEANYELVDGELVEKRMGLKSTLVAGKLNRRIDEFLDTHPLGWVFTEGGFACFKEDGNRLRRPDVAFVSKDKFPDDDVPDSYGTVPPDLVVEIVSPKDKAEKLENKLNEYLEAGVKVIWVVYPKARRARILRSGSGVEVFAGGVLECDDVLPGLRIPLAEILPPKKDRPKAVTPP